MTSPPATETPTASGAGSVTTAADVPKAVAGALDLIKLRADEVERERKLTDDVVGALRSAGVNRMFLPAALGGFEMRPSASLDVIEQIAAADGSTGWCAAIGSGSNLFGGYLPEEGARVVFADPDAATASMLAPLGTATPSKSNGTTGLTLTGRWPFTSNCLHSSWIALGASFHDGDDGAVDPVPRLVFVPASDVTVHDTWNAAGLRGTGSHDTSLDGVAIERSHSCALSDEAWPDGPLWRVPMSSILPACLGAVTLGIGRAAVDEVLRQVNEGRAARRGQLADDPIALADIGTADATLRAARSGLHVALDEVWQTVLNGDIVDKPAQARIVLSVQLAVDAAVDAADTAQRLGGGASAYLSRPLGRALRDAQTARQHFIFSRHHRAAMAKAVAGLDVAAPPFFM